LSSVQIVNADLDNPIHASGIIGLIKQYASEPGGGGQGLPAETEAHLIERLKIQPHRLVLLALIGDAPIGVAVCFRGFSTFAAQPLINIHDLAVMPEFRGQGAGGKLIEAVKSIAIEEGCCKVTLEVYTDNESARRLYRRYGFSDPQSGNVQTLSLGAMLP
jgi:ribosomal protein S18 acetylase RimI-like enzyme